ncbi:MAG TPA: hypothetical protein HPP83_02730 [Candidatus Hydrogenedentes bacterium]|nr:hypothetical protein [Candidatus Hydrogenedentota bacterium]
MKVSLRKMRQLVLALILLLLLGSWALAGWQMHLLKPDLAQQKDTMVQQVRTLFEDFGEQEDEYEIQARISMRREFLIFGQPCGTVILKVRFVDAEGEGKSASGAFRFRRSGSKWPLEKVVGSLLSDLTKAMATKHPEVDREKLPSRATPASGPPQPSRGA